jgi:hypothetical protein
LHNPHFFEKLSKPFLSEQSANKPPQSGEHAHDLAHFLLTWDRGQLRRPSQRAVDCRRRSDVLRNCLTKSAKQDRANVNPLQRVLANRAAVYKNRQAPELHLCYFFEVDTHANGRVGKAAHLLIITLGLIFCDGCSAFAQNSTHSPAKPATAAAFCLAPVLSEAAERVAAVKPAVANAKKTFADGGAIGIVDGAPLISLAELVLDVNACYEQVAGAEAFQSR